MINKSPIDIYPDELRFLIKLKESISIVNNRTHDKLAFIAIEKLVSVIAMGLELPPEETKENE